MTPLDAGAQLDRAQAAGIAVFAIETMRGRGGFRLPRRRADLWYLARDARDALKGTAPSPGPGLDAALSHPAVSSVIVTTTRIAHLEANARAAGLIPQTG
jgi:aryl-alcohol dehydrogenase-like predicted oxidoreductase